MKAAVCRQFGEPLTIEDIALAPPGPGEISVKMAACAIFHSDIMFMDGAWGGALPAVYGHEAAGTVEAVGEGVDRVAVGDHVVVTLIRSCGHYHYCSQGHAVACDTSFALDAKSPLTTSNSETITHGLRTGAFAEYVVVHHSQAVTISPTIPFNSASLLACGVITGFDAVTNTANISAGSTVVIIGTGGVGLNSVQGAAIAGAMTIIAIDISDSKLQVAKTFGATYTINASSNDVREQVYALTNGRGADYVFVTVGAKSAIDSSYELMGRTGSVVLVGMLADGVMSQFDPVVAGGSQRILGSKMGSSRVPVDVPYLAKLYQQGRLKLDELISGTYPLEDINEAIASVKQGDALRNVIVF